ncbi:hypothetical protein KHF85_05685 [Xanthomonas translucens pv. graminis]|nr:hypothetical protein KHF85_05685 [Xanthomonas translucens pv. graminis]
MRPAALPPVSPRATGQETDLESALLQREPDRAPSPRHANAQIDAQLQGLPQRPVAPPPAGGPTMSTGQRIAHGIAAVAGAAATATGVASVSPIIVGSCGLAFGNAEMKRFGGMASLAGIATTGTLLALQRLASAYAHGSNIEARASALGTTEACLRRAVDLVTVPQEHERSSHLMSEAESNALAEQLMHLATREPSILDPRLVQVVGNAGDNAEALIAGLLELNRQSAPEPHAAAASCV